MKTMTIMITIIMKMMSGDNNDDNDDKNDNDDKGPKIIRILQSISCKMNVAIPNSQVNSFGKISTTYSTAVWNTLFETWFGWFFWFNRSHNFPYIFLWLWPLIVKKNHIQKSCNTLATMCAKPWAFQWYITIMPVNSRSICK